MDGMFYDDNMSKAKDRDAILLQFQEGHQIPEQSSNLTRDEDTSNANGQRLLNPTVFSISYYQQFFNVNTDDVLKRLKGSLLPSLKANYYETLIKGRPDLYGPVWVCLTLAFAIAIGSNMLDYFTTSEDKLNHWKYGFHVITKALLVVFVYSWIIPVLLWSMLKWYLTSQVNISALELICTYGYAIVIYIPLSICWIVHVPYLQWILVILGAISSIIVLISTMQPMVSKENYTIVGAIVVLHIFFTIMIFLSFFHVK